VPKNVYDFKVPTSTPDLSNLRKPASLDLERAKKLFIPQIPSNPRRDPKAAFSCRDESKESFRTRQGKGEPKTSPPDVKLDWDLAGKLFIPNFSGKNGGHRKR
jgi:hypothetical protein